MYAYPFILSLTADGHLYGIIRTSSGTSHAYGSTLLSKDIWYHCVLTFGQGERRIYLNGQLDNKVEIGGSLILPNNECTILGGNYNGSIDEVKIYNRILSTNEIQILSVNKDFIKTPVIEPEGGCFNHSVEVKMNCRTEDSLIYYTLDSSQPDQNSILYTGPFLLNQTTVINAVSFRQDLGLSYPVMVNFSFTSDTEAPQVLTANAIGQSLIRIRFSEDLQKETAECLANYSVNTGIDIINAKMEENKSSVLLTVSELDPLVSYTVTVSNIRDSVGNVMTSAVQIPFTINILSIENGLVGSWELDEGTGFICHDTSDNSNHGEVIGPEWTQDSHFGNALLFNGSNYINLGTDNFGLGITNEFSISLWFKFTGTPGGNLISRSPYAFPFCIRLTADGYINTIIRTTTGTNYLTGTTRLESGQWYHCVVTYGNGIRTIYINSLSDIVSPLSGTLGFRAYEDNTRIGEGFSGIIDEVKIYSRVLSIDEVQALTITP